MIGVRKRGYAVSHTYRRSVVLKLLDDFDEFRRIADLVMLRRRETDWIPAPPPFCPKNILGPKGITAMKRQAVIENVKNLHRSSTAGCAEYSQVFRRGPRPSSLAGCKAS